MPLKRRYTPRLIVALLAVPVIAAAYAAFFSRRALSVGRAMAVAVLGVGVIGSVYAELAARQAVRPARRAPLPLTLAAALAVVLATSGVPTATVRAANDQAEAVIGYALGHLGAPYVWGAAGPDTFDCSGFVYRAFKEAGELPLIGGRRLTAAGYYKYFATRGLTSKTRGSRGDLVVYGGGTHIGIYLGDGKVVSALNPSQDVLVHGLNALHNSFTTFLNVDWTMPQEVTTTEFVNNVPPPGPTDEDSGGEGGDAAGDGSTDGGKPAAIATGHAFGSLFLRSEPAPGKEILGWVGKGTNVEILEAGHSPGGALWYKVRKPTGKEGWIWSYWVRVIEGSVGG